MMQIAETRARNSREGAVSVNAYTMFWHSETNHGLLFKKVGFGLWESRRSFRRSIPNGHIGDTPVPDSSPYCRQAPSAEDPSHGRPLFVEVKKEVERQRPSTALEETNHTATRELTRKIPLVIPMPRKAAIDVQIRGDWR